MWRNKLECTHTNPMSPLRRVVSMVLHGESITDRASPRTPTQRTFQQQEAVQPQRNQTILQADTPAQKAKYSYKRSHPTPLEADAHTSHVHKNASARTQSPGGRPPSTCTHRTSQPAEVADAVSVCWVCTCVTLAMAGWLHGVCVGACWGISPQGGFSLSLCCNHSLRTVPLRNIGPRGTVWLAFTCTTAGRSVE